MEQIKSGSIGAILAVVVLILVIVLLVVGQMQPLTAGLFAALALSRLT
jgi:hypothetical protein